MDFGEDEASREFLRQLYEYHLTLEEVDGQLHIKKSLGERESVFANKHLFTCAVCFTECAMWEGFTLEPCAHDICKACMESYMDGKIRDADVVSIACPHSSGLAACPTRVSYYDVRKVVSGEAFDKYEAFLLSETLKRDVEIRWCPNPRGCGNAVAVGDGRCEARFACGECHYESCTWCSSTWHQGTCDSHRKWKEAHDQDERLFSRWARQTRELKRCPQCKTRIEKNEGCNHMTCTRCQYQFCWLCKGKYTSNHYDNLNPLGCPGMSHRRWTTGQMVAVKAAVGVGVVVTSPLLLAAAVVVGPVIGAIKLHRHVQRKRRGW